MRLYVARHAKSSHKHGKLADIDRPLSKRGRRDATQMAAYLASRDTHADWLLASDSVRTTSTAQLIGAGLGLDAAIVQLDHRLYLADADTLLDVLRETPADRQVVMLVAHNPGVSNLVGRLTGTDDAPDLPTMAVATLDLNIGRWSDLGGGCAALLGCVAPKHLPDAAPPA